MKTIQLSPMAQWASALPPKKITVTLSPEFIRTFCLQDVCMMALVFQYGDHLLRHLAALSPPYERSDLALLARQKLSYTLDRNANLLIQN